MITAKQIKTVSYYNKAIQNIDLADLLSSSNSEILPKFPKRKKLYRTLSLAKELRKLGKEYFYFHDNAIAMEFINGGTYKKKTICIIANDHCYRIRVDVWTFDKTGGHFFYKEIDSAHGHQLLWELVSQEILDKTFLPPAPENFYEPHGGVGL